VLESHVGSASRRHRTTSKSSTAHDFVDPIARIHTKSPATTIVDRDNGCEGEPHTRPAGRCGWVAADAPGLLGPAGLRTPVDERYDDECEHTSRLIGTGGAIKERMNFAVPERISLRAAHSVYEHDTGFLRDPVAGQRTPMTDGMIRMYPISRQPAPLRA